MHRMLLVALILLLTSCDQGWTEAEKLQQMTYCMKTFPSHNGKSEDVQAACECWINKGIEAGLPPDADPGPELNLKWEAIAESCMGTLLQ